MTDLSILSVESPPLGHASIRVAGDQVVWCGLDEDGRLVAGAVRADGARFSEVAPYELPGQLRRVWCAGSAGPLLLFGVTADVGTWLLWRGPHGWGHVVRDGALRLRLGVTRGREAPELLADARGFVSCVNDAVSLGSRTTPVEGQGDGKHELTGLRPAQAHRELACPRGTTADLGPLDGRSLENPAALLGALPSWAYLAAAGERPVLVLAVTVTVSRVLCYGPGGARGAALPPAPTPAAASRATREPEVLLAAAPPPPVAAPVVPQTTRETPPFKVEPLLVASHPALRELLGPHHEVPRAADLAYEAELRDLARLALPGLPRVFEATRGADGALVTVYEAPAPSLAWRLGAGPLSHQEVVRLGRDLCAVLAALRAAGHAATHLTPAHVAGHAARYFLSSPAPRGREKLLTLAHGARAVPREGFDTLRYLPVEALEDTRRADDPAAEVQALGLLLWRARSGLKPWADERKTLGLFRAKVAGAPPGPPLPPGPLAELLSRCLEVDPARRPASVREVEQALAAE